MMIMLMKKWIQTFLQEAPNSGLSTLYFVCVADLCHVVLEQLRICFRVNDGGVGGAAAATGGCAGVGGGTDGGGGGGMGRGGELAASLGRGWAQLPARTPRDDACRLGRQVDGTWERAATCWETGEKRIQRRNKTRRTGNETLFKQCRIAFGNSKVFPGWDLGSGREAFPSPGPNNCRISASDYKEKENKSIGCWTYKNITLVSVHFNIKKEEPVHFKEQLLQQTHRVSPNSRSASFEVHSLCFWRVLWQRRP